MLQFTTWCTRGRWTSATSRARTRARAAAQWTTTLFGPPTASRCEASSTTRTLRKLSSAASSKFLVTICEALQWVGCRRLNTFRVGGFGSSLLTLVCQNTHILWKKKLFSRWRIFIDFVYLNLSFFLSSTKKNSGSFFVNMLFYFLLGIFPHFLFVFLGCFTLWSAFNVCVKFSSYVYPLSLHRFSLYIIIVRLMGY